jgi:esterase/lipase
MRIKIKFSMFFLLIYFYSFSQNENTKYEQIGFKMEKIVTKKDTIYFLYKKAKTSLPKPTIIFLQGSKPLPIVFYSEKKIGTILPFKIDKYETKFNFVIIARKGIPLVGNYEKDSNGYVDLKGNIPIDYIKNDNLYYRTFQAKKVLNNIYKKDWCKKDSIFVIGHSEGYRVAAKLSENNNKISKLICLSADPFNRTIEDLAKQRLECFYQNNDSTYQSSIETINKEHFDLCKSKVNKNDFNLYNWLSYNKNFIYKSFEKFKNPLLVVYGTDDINSFHNDLLPYILNKKNIYLKAYSDLDHNFFRQEYDKDGNPTEKTYLWDQVFDDVIKWIITK